MLHNPSHTTAVLVQSPSHCQWDILIAKSNGTNCLNLFHPIEILVSTAASASPSTLNTHTHIHFTALWTLSGIIQVSRYQKGKTNLDFTEGRDSEWQWYQLGLCKWASHSRQITTPAPHHSVLLQAGCPSCHPTNSIKALKATCHKLIH